MAQPPDPLTARHPRRPELVAATAFALLHVDDVESLGDSILARMPLTQRHAEGSTQLFAAGAALRDELLEIVTATVERFPAGRPTDRLQQLRATLVGIALEGRSITAIANEHGRPREG